jgi:hypothetical protein
MSRSSRLPFKVTTQIVKGKNDKHICLGLNFFLITIMLGFHGVAFNQAPSWGLGM